MATHFIAESISTRHRSNPRDLVTRKVARDILPGNGNSLDSAVLRIQL